MPFAIAAASTNVLNVEPGWRRACASEVELVAASGPGVTAVIARIAPFAGSIETSAAAGSVGMVERVA